MEIQLVGATNNLFLNRVFDNPESGVHVDLKKISSSLEEENQPAKDLILEDLRRFSQNFARICYSEKDWPELLQEKSMKGMTNSLIKAGHHSLFEHIHFNLYFKSLPKILAMTLNNEKQYITSEKSARYTTMEASDDLQREKYNKWMNILEPKIENVFPDMDNKEERAKTIHKLAMENARYMTSVFTPTKIAHTLNWRQINFLVNSLEKNEHLKASPEMNEKLEKDTSELIELLSPFRISGLENQTDRHLSLFDSRDVETHFGDVYSTSYLGSFARLAQEQRHRTISYHISDGTQLGAPQGFYVPDIVPENMRTEWIKDLKEIASYDFPQAQLVKINERGKIEDFRSKTMLRLCSPAQYEIMRGTLETGEKYKQFQEEYGKNSLKPKCIQGFKCNEKERCAWKGKKALERIV